MLLKNLRNTNVDHAEYTEGTLVEAGCYSLRDRSDDVALSRLKQGFDSPRERHQINGLVGVCDAALWQWTTRWTSPSGKFTHKSVELISRCADPPPATPDMKRGRGRISPRQNFRYVTLVVADVARWLRRREFGDWIDRKQANRKSIGVWGFGLPSWGALRNH